MKHIKKINEFLLEGISEGLTIKEVCDGVLSGSIKVNMEGHNDLEYNENAQVKKHKEYFTKVLEHIKRIIDRPKSINIQELYLEEMQMKFNPGQSLSLLLSLPERYCWGCNGRLMPILKSYNEVSFISTDKYYDLTRGIPGKPSKDSIDVKDIPECELVKENIKDRIVTEINLPTGDLVITNFFREKEIYDAPGYSGDINSLLGRINLAKYLANMDIGYGQMGNMSLEVWKKTDGTEVLFTGSYNYDEETDIEGEYEYDGFKHLGNISLSVWRWMCADLVTLKKHNEKLPKLLEDDSVEDDYRDFILAKVKPGKWTIEHYYDVEERKDGIYTRLYIK
jgi:hypothetical protein